MEVLQDGVLAFLAATGAAALFWLLTGWLRRQLRGLPPIVICDCGLDEAGLSRARELTQRYDNVLLLAPEEIIQNLP